MTILGEDIHTAQPIALSQNARSRGIYVIGSTGTGKTTFLQSVAYQDMLAGHGVCVLDPHGDMIDWLLLRLPPERANDVILFNPADFEHPYGLNLLECDRDDINEVRWVVSTILVTLRRLFAHSWGPRLEHVLGHTLWTAMAIPGSTLIEVLLLLTDPLYRKSQLDRLNEPLLQTFWQDFPKGEHERHELVSSTVNKLTPFLLDRGMRNMVGQTTSTIHLRQIMDERKILLVNLSKGDLGENNSSLLGSVLVNLILIAALSRRDIPPEQRGKSPFHLIVDEYQNFASESFAVLQSEARKYAVDLIVAHQFRDQLDLQNRGAALNVGNFIAFRTTGVDGPELAAQFDNTPPPPDRVWETIRIPSQQHAGLFQRGQFDQPVFGPRRLYSDVVMEKANALANLPPFTGWAKIMGETLPRQFDLVEHEFRLFDPDDQRSQEYFGVSNEQVATHIRAYSQELASVRDEVEASITERTAGAADIGFPMDFGDLERDSEEGV